MRNNNLFGCLSMLPTLQVDAAWLDAQRVLEYVDIASFEFAVMSP